MQAILVELLDTFDVSLPDQPVPIQRLPAGLMVPMIDSHPERGAQMPLRISLSDPSNQA